MALSKKFRLSKKNDFEAVFENGRKIYGKYVSLFAVKNNLKFNRFGVIVSNKVSKKAVERNRIRRRITEVIKQDFKLLKNGFDFVIVAKHQIRDKNYQSIKDEILELFVKQGILNK